MHLRTYSLAAATAVLGASILVGCGGSSSSTTASVQTGTFIDSAVKGLYYVSGSTTGTTDENGTFKYESGKTVKFYLGQNGALLGETNGSTLVTPLDLSDDGIDGTKTTNMLLLLQSLDNDGNATNGIVIDTTKASKIKSVDLSDDANVSNSLTAAGATVKTSNEVKAHFRESLAELSTKGTVPATATVVSTEFIGMEAPTTADKMDHIYSEAYVAVKYSDGTRIIRPIEYKTLMNTGDVIGGTTVGAILDVNGNPIMDTSTATATPFVSDTPDGQSVMKIGNTIQMVSQFEYVTSDASGASRYGVLPAMMNLSQLAQDTNGNLSVTSIKNIDTSSVGGLWITCAASMTPWTSHLGSEEYEPNAYKVELGTGTGTDALNGPNAYFGDTTTANVYNYGFIHETSVTAAGATTTAKHYSMGRFSHELAEVMPDNKTVYFGDDGDYTMLFMYVADTAGNLSAGTLYAAKWNQTSSSTDRAVKANLTWIKLGHATDAAVKALIDNKTKFSDIFDTAGAATAGFTKIKTYKGTEYLKVKSGMEFAAAFLESRRYGALLGATSEFNKMEGVTVNAKDKKVYVAISYMEKGMATSASDPVDDIHVPVEKAGAVFELALTSGQKDTQNAAISSDYVAASMNAMPVLTGLTIAKDAFGNTGDVNKIANPDNLKYSEKMRTLFVGEDSGLHVNNYVWAYNVDTKKLSRILSTTVGAEATGLQAIDNLNGHGYVMSSIQHPGDWTTTNATVQQALDAVDKKKAAIGYMKLPVIR
ncbi:PhoX family protein [Sulfuricurvum sp.]|uniref:PhoX family protein n=1 Tax=Sulfuricurvum sp. TaxID=2025608 RepID=UPI002D2290F4|nr:alkaline phosphatase PhoX [Sulfuricurvum sp.]HZF70671.1 alkaline phosphatase PhoX [Sulfuricurvum sp.]